MPTYTESYAGKINRKLLKKQRIIAVAAGREPADLVLKNATYLNVFSNELCRGDIAVAEGQSLGQPLSFGGPYLAIKKVNETLKMNVTRYCSINFKGFSAIVDQLDGVDIQLTGGEAEEIGKSADYPARDQDGVAHLNGAQALAYCRIRNLDNNFGRSNRQRKFLEAMMDKVMRSNSLDGILGLVEKTMAYLDTNLSAGDVMALIFAVATQYQGLEMNSVPGNGEFTYQVIREMDVVVADAEKMTASLHSFIYEQ